jgi:hypothetical protein
MPSSAPMNATSSTASQADPGKTHEFLVGHLAERKKELVDAGFKHGAVICLVLGWIVSSQQAQRFFAADWWVQFFATAGLITYAIVYTGWVAAHYRHSHRIFKNLEAIAFMDSRLFAFLVIRRSFALSFVLLHELMCLVMIAFIWMIPHYRDLLFPLKP